MKNSRPNLKTIPPQAEQDLDSRLVSENPRIPPHTKCRNFPSPLRSDDQIKPSLPYIWQSAPRIPLPNTARKTRAHGKELFEHARLPSPAIPSAKATNAGGTFSANLTPRRARRYYDYLVRCVHTRAERTRPYCSFEKGPPSPKIIRRRACPTFLNILGTSAAAPTTATSCKSIHDGPFRACGSLRMMPRTCHYLILLQRPASAESSRSGPFMDVLKL